AAAAGVVVERVDPAAVLRLRGDVEVLNLLPDGAVDPRPRLLAGVQAEQGVLRVRVVRRTALFLIAPAAELAVAIDAGADQPIDVVLDAGPVPRVADLGIDHRLQADDVSVLRFDLAQGLQAALDDRVIRLDAGVEQ